MAVELVLGNDEYMTPHWEVTRQLVLADWNRFHAPELCAHALHPQLRDSGFEIGTREVGHSGFGHCG